MSQLDIGVRLLNEGTDVWVMMPAQEVAFNVCVILDNEMANDPALDPEFKPGDLVMVVDHKSADGSEFPIAMRLYPGTIP